MRLMIVTDEEFPSNRPMLSELWNKEFTKRHHSIVWIMKGKPGTTAVSRTAWESNTVITLPNYSSSTIGKLFTQLYFIFYLLTSIVPIQKRDRCDLMHVHNSIIAGFVVSVFSMISPLKFSFAITFPFYLLYKKTPETSRSMIRSLQGSLYRRMLSLVFRRCSLILPISYYYQQLLENEYHLPPNKFIPVSESASALFLEYASQLKQDDRKTKFIYIGEMSRNRNLFMLIDAFNLVHKECREAELHLVGWGLQPDDVPSLERYARAQGLQHSVKISGKIEYTQIPDRVSGCIAGLSPIPPIELYLISTPTKCIDYLSLGVPAIANSEIYDQKSLIEQSGGGILVEYDARQFADAMIRLLNEPDTRNSMGSRGRQWIRDNRTFAKCAEKIEKQFSMMI